MKNYYKILGVKENASEEEIREHWVELMRKLHPDQRMEGAVEDERVKEINEAYQVLKHSSTRVEYDLKRAYDRRKRNSYLRRLSFPFAIFVVFVTIGTFYLRKSQVTLQANLLTRDRVNQIDEMNQTGQIDQRNQIDQIDRRNERNQTNQTNPIDQLTASMHRIDTSTHPRIDSIDSTTQRRKDRMAQRRSDPIDAKALRPNDSMTQLSFDLSPLTFNLIIDSTTQQPNNPINQTDQVGQRNQRDATTQRPGDPKDAIDAITQSTQQRNDASTDERVDASTHPRIAASPPNRIDASTHLIATEEEVRQFFANYTEKYTQKDLDGFLSLFSPRAVQNHQDGLEGIRKIYGNFFKLSQEIKYWMDDIRVEIYQNAVEVKARYELVQILKKGGDKKIWRGDIRWTLVKEHEALKIFSLDYQHQKSP